MSTTIVQNPVVPLEIDAAEVFTAAKALFHPDQPHELRGLPSKRSRLVRISDPDRLIKAVNELANDQGIYYTLSPVRPDLGNRKAASDEDIPERFNFLIDVDPVKAVPDAMATQEEKDHALGLANTIHLTLTNDFAWPMGTLIDSGNGGHLVYRVALANSDQARNLCQRILKGLAARFDTDKAKVDTGVYNASRIAKLPGTVVRKGPGTSDRPHRMAKLLFIPDQAIAVSLERLEAAAEAMEERAAIKEEAEHKGNGKANHGGRGFKILTPVTPSAQQAWFDAALSDEERDVISTQPGGRRNRLRDAAYTLGGQLHHGYLDEATVTRGLTAAGLACGLEADEIADTIRDGLADGKAKPMAWPDKLDRPNGTGGQSAKSTETSNLSTNSLADAPIVNSRGFWVSCLHNSLLWLVKEGVASTIRYDRFRHVIVVDDRSLDDEIVIAMAAKIEASTRMRWHQEHVRSAIVDIGHRNEYSSLTAWLDGLKWDGTRRLTRFFHDAYGCELTAYTEACAKVLFLSGIARAYQPGCQADVMVVLIGPQGIGKSMGVSRLCPDPSWYADDLGCDLFDRKAGEGLRGKWLIEFSEFSRINRATLDVVKSFVSRRSDYYRPAYGRTHKDYPRTCVFVGTTNDPHPLHDRENRRFMPLACVQANLDWISANREQLWGEAVSLYRQSEPWWVSDPNVRAEVASKQEEARQDDCWESILDEKLGSMSAIKMKDAADALDIRPDRLDRSTQTRIGIALKAIGFERKRVREFGKLVYWWAKP